MNLPQILDKALEARLITQAHHYGGWRRCFLRRARYALKRNLAEPGDCKGDMPLLVGLAIAEANIGRRAGWIPIVQGLGVKIANLIET